MNHFAPKLRPALVDLSSRAVGSDFRVISKLYGGLLGPEYIVCARGCYFRVGQLTLDQWKMRGLPEGDLGLLEVDPDGDPIDYPEDRACSAADREYQLYREGA